MRTFWATIAITFVLGSALAACDPENNGTPTAKEGRSGFDKDRSIASLSSDEQSALCDWSLETQGGAGHVTECGQGEQPVVHTKATCIEEMEAIERLSGCTQVYVAEIEQCSEEVGTAACDVSFACDDISHRIEACTKSDAH